MSGSDQRQSSHDLPNALSARLQVIRQGTDSWHEYHQTGVLLSELAHSAWCIKFSGWRERCIYFLHQAFDVYFAQARQLVPRDNSGLTAHYAIDCDEALALARLARVSNSGTDVMMVRAQQLLEMVTSNLLVNDLPPHENAAAMHQIGIAYAFLAQLAWGNCMGYPQSADIAVARKHFADACTFFFADPTIDDERAHRSLLCVMALGYHAAGDHNKCRYYADEAWQKAKGAGDDVHKRRAMLIWFFGSRGERFLRRRRDGKLARKLIL